MIGTDDFTRKFKEEISDFLSRTESLITLQLDKSLIIKEHNDCFAKLLKLKESCVGKPITDYLTPESQDMFRGKDGRQIDTVSLSFISTDNSLMALFCRLYPSGDKGVLLMGGNLMLQNNEVLEKMTHLTNEMANMSRDLYRKNRELEEAKNKLRIVGGILPICMHCKGIRDDQGYWNQLEKFLSENSDAMLSHGICDKCMDEKYPDVKT